MPRYFFHYQDGTEFIDHDGVELAGIEEARELAVQASGEAIRDLGGGFWENGEWRTWVTDESGATVCTLRLSGDPSAT